MTTYGQRESVHGRNEQHMLLFLVVISAEADELFARSALILHYKKDISFAFFPRTKPLGGKKNVESLLGEVFTATAAKITTTEQTRPFFV